MFNPDKKKIRQPETSLDKRIRELKENPESTAPSSQTQQTAHSQKLVALKQQIAALQAGNATQGQQQTQLTENQKKLAALKQQSPQTAQSNQTPQSASASSSPSPS